MSPAQMENPTVAGRDFRNTSKQTNGSDDVSLGTACSCGGVGGRPGQAPICPPCWKFHRALMASAARQASCYFFTRGEADRMAMREAS
jgi:hypothetical protein